MIIIIRKYRMHQSKNLSTNLISRLMNNTGEEAPLGALISLFSANGDIRLSIASFSGSTNALISTFIYFQPMSGESDFVH